MIVGLKVAADKRSFDDLARANPPFAEVWFNIAKSDDYQDIFTEMKKRRMKVGLHYWDALPDGTQTNLAYPDTALLQTTIANMQKTIDIAAQNGFQYVNVHPGSRAKLNLDFAKESFTVLTRPVSIEIATETFLEHATKLHEYAASKGIIFTVESVPKYVTNGWYSKEIRLKPFDAFELPLTAIKAAATAKLFVANDFVHTGASVDTDNAHDVWQALKSATVELAPQTRLIHMGFLIPPYNGTDYHGQIVDPVFTSTDALPNLDQAKELLSIFNNRDDVYILCEPNGDHVGNFLALQKLVTDSQI